MPYDNNERMAQCCHYEEWFHETCENILTSVFTDSNLIWKYSTITPSLHISACGCKATITLSCYLKLQNALHDLHKIMVNAQLSTLAKINMDADKKHCFTK